MKDFLQTMMIIALIAAMLVVLFATGGTAAPALVALLAIGLGVTALTFPMNAQASTQVPMGCCMTPESDCEKPDIFRAGNASSPRLENIRVNRPNGSDDVVYEAPVGFMSPVPENTSCANAADPLLDGLLIMPGGGASLEEVVTKDPPTWKLSREAYPPSQLCLVKDGRNHWSLGPKSVMDFRSLCGLLSGMNSQLQRVK